MMRFGDLLSHDLDSSGLCTTGDRHETRLDRNSPRFGQGFGAFQSTMASVSFRTCDCGIKLRVVQQQDTHRQLYVCRCGQRIGFDGTVLMLHFSHAERPLNDYDWTQIPDSEIQSVY